MAGSYGDRQLRRSDYALLGLFSVVLFGFSLIGGRVLTMHESRLPQTSREMLSTGDWLIPMSGGRPWLERPPLPHWITAGVASIFGRCDQVWIVRIPPALMGLISVLLVAWMATGWYGRGIGILSGLTLATTFEFTRYAWLAEEDIFLAAVVLIPIALFVHLEFFRAPRSALEKDRLLGKRPWAVFAFFLVLGLSNLVKGLMFGAAMVLIPTVAFMIWNGDLKRFPRYLWFWGWLTCAIAAVAWLVAATMRYPDMLLVWFGDVTNRTDGIKWNEPFWYYWVNLLWEILPWTAPALYGLWLTRTKAFAENASPERFLWCWALLPLVVFSFPTHKHHHYLVPCLAPWAVLGALGSVRLWEQVPQLPPWLRNPRWMAIGVGVPAGIAAAVCLSVLSGPLWIGLLLVPVIPAAIYGLSWGICNRDARLAIGTLYGIVGLAYLASHVYAGRYVDGYRDDSLFLEQVKRSVNPDQPVFVNSEGASLNMFRHMFYLGENARVIHNLTFLRDDQIRDPEVYVIARFKDAPQLTRLGDSEVMLESKPMRRSPPEMRWVLFRLRYAENLTRYSTRDVTYTALQVMERESGPYLGQRL